MARKSKGGGGGGKVVLGFLLGAAAFAGGSYAWKQYGGSANRIRSEMPSMSSMPSGVGSDGGHSGDPAMGKTSPSHQQVKPKPPFGTSEEVFEAGAHVYRARCASCHGTPNFDAKPAKGHPQAPQLWKKGTGVSGWDPGDIYTRVAEGKHGSMPPFAGKMSSIQIWQVALLLDNASDELPDPVVNILEKK